jgi:hypothetical protein
MNPSKLITLKFSEYGFVASITILPLNRSDRGSSCLSIYGIASRITSPNAIASSMVRALIFEPTPPLSGLSKSLIDSGS